MTKRFTSPVGRFVQGDLFTPSLTDQKGNPRTFKSGPKIGQPSPQWFFALAIAKNDPAWPAFKAELDAEAMAAWPHLFPGGACVLPTFASKIIDGDGVDTMGRPFSRLEGFAGHWVIRFTSGFPIRVVKPMGGSVWSDVTNPEEAKRGYYIRVNGDTETNGDAGKPGMYMNGKMVEIVGPGPVIVGGPDAAEAFAAPAALPPGALTASTALAAPGYAAPPVAPAAPAPPYAGYMAAPPAAPAAPAPPAPPVVPVRQMLPAAGANTYEAMIAAGWTDETLRAHGMMA